MNPFDLMIPGFNDSLFLEVQIEPLKNVDLTSAQSFFGPGFFVYKETLSLDHTTKAVARENSIFKAVSHKLASEKKLTIFKEKSKKRVSLKKTIKGNSFWKSEECDFVISMLDLFLDQKRVFCSNTSLSNEILSQCPLKTLKSRGMKAIRAHLMQTWSVCKGCSEIFQKNKSLLISKNAEDEIEKPNRWQIVECSRIQKKIKEWEIEGESFVSKQFLFNKLLECLKEENASERTINAIKGHLHPSSAPCKTEENCKDVFAIHESKLINKVNKPSSSIKSGNKKRKCQI